MYKANAKNTLVIKLARLHNCNQMSLTELDLDDAFRQNNIIYDPHEKLHGAIHKITTYTRSHSVSFFQINTDLFHLSIRKDQFDFERRVMRPALTPMVMFPLTF